MYSRYLSILIVSSSLVAAVSDPERIWQDYLEWYRTQPISLTDTRSAYREHLRERRLSDAEITEITEVIENLSKQRQNQLHRLFFDRTYAGRPRFNSQPNRLLVETVAGLPPGRALDIHMGQGRNALYLASLGWQVTGFDYSEEGVRAAREAAARQGLKLEAVVARHEDFDFGRARWDLVVLSYAWVPLGEPYISRIKESLKTGGVLVFEGLLDESGSEAAAPWLPRPNQLLHLFLNDFRILRYEDVRAEADWSWRPERIARLVAEKR